MSITQDIAIHWFRQDLRLADNPAFRAAASRGPVLPIFILDDVNSGEHRLGSASRWWLHHSLQSLNRSLDSKLVLFSGDPIEILKALAAQYSVGAIYWNRCYEPWRIERDKKIKDCFQSTGIETTSFNGSLLWEPWQVLKDDGSPYKVFTPFYRRGCLARSAPELPEPAPEKVELVSRVPDSGAVGSIEHLNLLPNIPWDKQLEPHWNIGEPGAHKKLNEFIAREIANYKKGRNFPAENAVSGLSPHIHFGELSPHQVWYAAKRLPANDNLDCFQSEMGWREFSYSLLYHFPEFPRKNLQPKFDRFPWQSNPNFLKAWQRGLTGYPLIDAGMRELWQTGYMHNRIRMVVGSFLVKNLLIHWHEGEKWFWDCLVDADLANNSAGWQWIAGCGADAAPYFRIFNPITQGEKFDPEGQYTRRFVPELQNIPNKYLFRPWEAPAEVLSEAGIRIGDNYPAPIVDVKASRQKALEAFASIKQ